MLFASKYTFKKETPTTPTITNYVTVKRGEEEKYIMKLKLSFDIVLKNRRKKIKKKHDITFRVAFSKQIKNTFELNS